MKALSLAFVLVCLGLGQARAQPGQTPPGTLAPQPISPADTRNDPPQVRTLHYGWQMVAVDTVTLFGASYLAQQLNGDTRGLVLVGAMTFSGSVMHLIHDNSRGAVISPLLRVGIPVAGGLAFGVAACHNDNSDTGLGCFAGAIAGAMLGYGTAILIDWIWLAKRDIVVTPSGWTSLRPSVTAAEGGMQAGLSLRF